MGSAPDSTPVSPFRILVACPSRETPAATWRQALAGLTVPSDCQLQFVELAVAAPASDRVDLRQTADGYCLDIPSRHDVGQIQKLICGLAPNLAADALLLMGYFDAAELQAMLAATAALRGAEIELATCGAEPVHRYFRLDALSRLPVIHNSAGLGFECELDAQCRQAELRQRCLSPTSARRPTWWGLARRLAKLRTTLRTRFHNHGLLYQLNLDIARTEQGYTVKLGYASSHEYALRTIRPGDSILDLGAGQEAYLAAPMKERGCSVLHAADLRRITNPDVDQVYQMNLNSDPLPDCLGQVDRVMLLDIIEHLADPEGFLLDMRRQVRDDAVEIVISTPNVAFIVTRLMLLMGQFNYGKTGILDRTHCRLFTFRSLRRMFRQCGYTVVSVDGVPPPIPKAIGDNAIARFLLALNVLAIRVLPGVFSYQIFARVRPDPDAQRVLSQARSYRDPDGDGIAG